MKKLKFKNIFFIILLIFCIFKILPIIILTVLNKNYFIYSNEKLKDKINTIISYDFIELINLEDKEKIIIKEKSNYIFTNEYNIEIQIDNFYNYDNYEIEYGINSELKIENITEKESKYIIYLEEGKNNINVILKNNNEIVEEVNNIVYYIKPYQKQFLDEYSKNCVQVYYKKYHNLEQPEKSLELIKNLGINKIRSDIFYNSIVDTNKNYDFEYYDNWVQYANKMGINILFEINGIYEKFGNIDDENKLKYVVEFATEILKRYDNIDGLEILNEPNYLRNGIGYVDEEDIKWYSKLVENIKLLNPDSNIISGVTALFKTDSNTQLSSKSFLEKITKNGAYKYSYAYSYHPYDQDNERYQNSEFERKLNEHKDLFTNFGGFIKNYVTEYGISAYELNGITEEIQASKLVQQSTILDYYDVELSSIYNFWNIGTDKNNKNHNYGIVRNDNTPKKSYYSLKKYYENTNGAEYIGTINYLEGIINENLEAHVYDKDGRPKIIVWSNNSDVTITIPYLNFKATNLYGEEIQPDENGNLVITTSPVYLDEVDYNYFYQAISNMAIEKYNEFTEIFAGEIAQVPELTSKIEENKKYMESVGQVENKIVGSATIQAMKNHFELGNLILQAYRDGKLQVEDVKVSSMLDMLNDIGDCYEDLVTVSAQTVEQAEIEQTNKVIQEAETTINNNQGCEIIYPVKILDFAKDHYEKATYINSLEEENDIKNGLIISNNLHASLLANWAKTFAQINIDKFVDEYIANNPVIIEYSTTELTNQNVKATIKTNAEIQITNNSNSKEHTFEQNGSFTFEYTIKGRALSITATVQNIDKVAPSISGVQRAKLYTKPVTPKINDENLKEIKLILNAQIVSDYKNGDTLEDEGFYELSATDKAGNITKTYFQIFINNDTDYKIEENYIKNVTNNTKKSDFDKKINLSVHYKIYRNETELKQDDIIATGDILTTEVGDNYTIIVPGDINKDGQVNLKDFIKMRIYLLLENNLDDIEMLAADCNNDNQPIGVKDYIRMRLIILMNEH